MNRFLKALMVGAAMAACAASAYAVAPEVGKSYSIKFLSNGNYLSSVYGNFKCQEGLSSNGFWTIEAATSGEGGYYLYNPVQEVYAYRSFQNGDYWSMRTSVEAQETSNFDFVAVDGEEDTYVLVILDTGQYVAADNPLQANCPVYGDKSEQAAVERGLVQFEELPFDPANMEMVYNFTKNNVTAYLSELEEDTKFADFVKRSGNYTDLESYIVDTSEDWKNANAELEDEFSLFKEAVDVFKNYFAALKYGNELKISAEAEYASAESLINLDEALAEEFSDGFWAVDVQESIDWVNCTCRGLIETNAVLANLEGARNYTDRIENPNAGTNDGWTLEEVDNSLSDFDTIDYKPNKTGQGYNNSGGDRIEPYWDGWNPNNTGWGNDFYQIVTLPAGTYRLSVFARSSKDSFTKYALYAGANSVDIPQLGSQSNVFDYGWNNYYLDFTLTEESPVQLGIIAATNKTGSWVSFTGFQLVRFPGEGEDPGENPEDPIVKPWVNLIKNAMDGVTGRFAGLDAPLVKNGWQMWECPFKYDAFEDMYSWEYGYKDILVEHGYSEKEAEEQMQSFKPTNMTAEWPEFVRIENSDNFSGTYTLDSYVGSPFSGRIATFRWDGPDRKNSWFAYPVNLKKGVYEFSCLAGEINNYLQDYSERYSYVKTRGVRVSISKNVGPQYLVYKEDPYDDETYDLQNGVIADGYGKLFEFAEGGLERCVMYRNKCNLIAPEDGVYYISLQGPYAMFAFSDFDLHYVSEYNGDNPFASIEDPFEEPEEEEATLRVKNGELHELVHYYVPGSNVKILPAAEEGWVLHSVILNDEDITDKTNGNGNMLIIENLRGHNTLNFVYTNVDPTVQVCEPVANQLHVVVYDDNIKVSGKADGDVVEVFDVNGISLYSGIESVIKLPAAQGVVLIKVGGQTYKGYIR